MSKQEYINSLINKTAMIKGHGRMCWFNRNFLTFLMKHSEIVEINGYLIYSFQPYIFLIEDHVLNLLMQS